MSLDFLYADKSAPQKHNKQITTQTTTLYNSMKQFQLIRALSQPII